MTRLDATTNLPPRNLDAERGVLSSVLLANEALDLINLRPDDFYDMRHAEIYRAITSDWNSGRAAIDLVTLAEALERRGTLSECGGAAYLNQIFETEFCAEHVRFHAEIVSEKSRCRRISEIGRVAHAAAVASDADSAEIISNLDRSILALQESRNPDEVCTMHAAVDAFEELENNPTAIHATGLVDVDRQIGGGLRTGQLMIVGGRPGSGKSVLAVQIAAAFARRNEPALVVSLEMACGEIAARLAKTIDRETLKKLPIHVADTATSLNRIAALVRLAVRRDGIQLAVVDYLQLVESADRTSNRERQVAEVSRTLKRLAMECDISVIGVSQLNRGSEQESRKPRLSDLRESGSIEQDADVVALLHRSEDECQLIVAKQRNGAPGLISLAFRAELFRFENAALSPFAGDFGTR